MYRGWRLYIHIRTHTQKKKSKKKLGGGVVFCSVYSDFLAFLLVGYAFTGTHTFTPLPLLHYIPCFSFCSVFEDTF